MPARVEVTVECLLVANSYSNKREIDGTTGPAEQVGLSPTAFFDILTLLHRT